jgi:hydrogenase-4 membrane subunit HyfE
MMNPFAWDSVIMLQILFYWGIFSSIIMLSAYVVAFWYRPARIVVGMQIILGILLTLIFVFFGLFEYMTHYIFIVLYLQILNLFVIPCLFFYLLKCVILKKDFKKETKIGIWILIFTGTLMINLMISVHDVYYSLLKLEII